MKRLHWLLTLALIPWATQGADLANGERINRSCALCHGQFGQGTPQMSPRLAGQDKGYLEKALKDYRDGARSAPTMTYAAGLQRMSERDIADVSAYLAQLEVPGAALVDIKVAEGDVNAGAREFKECKGCHRADGMGKPKEQAPRLAGQHVDYVLASISLFKERQRKHGQEDDDQELFDELEDEDLKNLAAHLATLDDPEYLAAQQVSAPTVAMAESEEHRAEGLARHEARRAEHEERRAEAQARQEARRTEHEERRAEALGRHEARLAQAEPPLAAPPPQGIQAAPVSPAATAPRAGAGLQISDITQTVAQMEVTDGLTPEDAIQAMMSKAAELNLKLVGQQEVSKELEARGVDSPHLTILQFCDPEDAKTMIVFNPIFASYMPCRIALVEDQAGKLWVMMLNLDMLIESKLIPPEVTEVAIRVNKGLLDVMVAGATGEF